MSAGNFRRSIGNSGGVSPAKSDPKVRTSQSKFPKGNLMEEGLQGTESTSRVDRRSGPEDRTSKGLEVQRLRCPKVRRSEGYDV